MLTGTYVLIYYYIDIATWQGARNDEPTIDIETKYLGTEGEGNFSAFNFCLEFFIHRKLYWALRRQVASNRCSYTIISEANNQPSDEEVIEKERERKRPDIQIFWVNML